MIKVHPRFRSEAEAFAEASQALGEAYDAQSERTLAGAINRETAIQIARLTHWRCAQEFLQR